MTQRILRTVGDMALKTEAGLRHCYTVLRRLGRKPSQQDQAAAELIAESGLFNGDWYLTRYPDAATSGMQPALHYVCVGAARGHDPGPSFSSSAYLALYPDVAVAEMNPLLHYLRFGKDEGRDIAAAGTSSHAAPIGGPWDDVPSEAPLAATEAVRFSLEPWLAEPEGAKSLPPDSQPDGPTLSLSQVSLGFVGGEGTEKLNAVAAFARLSGVDVAEARIMRNGATQATAAANRGTPASDTMLSLGGAEGFDFGDVWFINDRDLRARLNAPPGCTQRFVLSCYQFAPATRLPATQPRLLRLATQVAPRGELDFADISTSNPYFPLLFTLTTASGALIATTLLPFPSLCRGGAHYGELLSTSDGKDYLSALRAVSHLLLEERLSDAGPPALARIEVDLKDATGAERIFSPDLRSWLGQEGGVTIAPAAPARRSEGRAARYLEESVTTPAPTEPSATRPFTLRLPADAIPSLRVLVSRQLSWPHDGEQIGAFVVAADADGAPRWCIMPPARADLAALQPEGGSSFPILLRSASAMRVPAAEQRAVHAEPLLLAVRFCHLSQPQTSRLIAPVAPDAPGPLLPTVGVDSKNQLSVLHHVSGSPAHLEAFLESLQRQRSPAPPEVILVLAADRSDHAALADKLLLRYFPETGRLVRHAHPGGRADRAERLRAAAATAQGQFLLFVGDDVVLHDVRTLGTLLTLAHDERAASASCLMIATDDPGQRMKLVSAGYYHHEASSGPSAGSIYLDACPDLAALPPATWPVAANDPRILMVRSDVWRKLGGFSAAEHEPDLDYGARAAMAGYSHYCTSAISVTLLGNVARAPAPTTGPLSPATRAGTVLRRLVA